MAPTIIRDCADEGGCFGGCSFSFQRYCQVIFKGFKKPLLEVVTIEWLLEALRKWFFQA
ncbi:hypothetical protein KEJ36_05950 [Candidatus Bathyarchaeota archaeon]|nr:hypothetical protein [Candidatus Bathyarchaeota archaeon]